MAEQQPFKWRHFEAESILLCVRWYVRYALSYRDLEEMMRERGLQVDHTTIYRWVQRYAPELEKRCRPHLKPSNDSWRVDETYVKVKGIWMYLYRAVDSQGNTLEFHLSVTRDAPAAKGFFAKALGASHTVTPRIITVDKNAASNMTFRESTPQSSETFERGSHPLSVPIGAHETQGCTQASLDQVPTPLLVRVQQLFGYPQDQRCLNGREFLAHWLRVTTLERIRFAPHEDPQPVAVLRVQSIRTLCTSPSYAWPWCYDRKWASARASHGSLDPVVSGPGFTPYISCISTFLLLCENISVVP